MRWKANVESKPYHMQQRVIIKFALLPIKTKDDEVRWLETVMIRQTYLMNPFGHWVNDYFIDCK